jgi:hypothetical protein
MKLMQRYRAHRDASRRRVAINRAINASPSHAVRRELEIMASR